MTDPRDISGNWCCEHQQQLAAAYEHAAQVCDLIEAKAWDEFRRGTVTRGSPHTEGVSDGAAACARAIRALAAQEQGVVASPKDVVSTAMGEATAMHPTKETSESNKPLHQSEPQRDIVDCLRTAAAGNECSLWAMAADHIERIERELRVAEAFHKVAVGQRDLAWHQLAAALKDVERLDWLEQLEWPDDAIGELVRNWRDPDGKRHGEGLRAAIDAETLK